MNTLRPVDYAYEPGYPRSLTQQEIIELLRPGLFRRFSATTMISGAMLLLTGCGNGTAVKAEEGAPKPAPKGPTTRSDAALKAKVDQLVAEVLGEKKGYWNDQTSLTLNFTLKGNPPVKYPHIPISFGNSYVGVFDTEAAKVATRRLFALYNIELKSNVLIEGNGFKFEADGYDEKTGMGFKLMVPAEQNGGRQELKAQPAEQALDASELKPLQQAIDAKKLHLFAVEANGYPNMDGDLYTPMQYYLASVVDYLNWVHGDREIDQTRIFGNLPGGNTHRSWRTAKPLPGCDFEAANDLANWKVSNGTGELSEKWAGFGKQSLLLKLDVGAQAAYTAPAGAPILVREEYAQFSAKLFIPQGVEETFAITFVLNGENESRSVVTEKVIAGTRRIYKQLMPKPPFKELKSIQISVEAKQPVSFFIDALGITLKAEDKNP